MAKVKEGKLYLNGNGRLALDEWTEFHCGDVVEVRLFKGYWLKMRFEINGRGEWYLCTDPDDGATLTLNSVEGVTVREVR